MKSKSYRAMAASSTPSPCHLFKDCRRKGNLEVMQITFLKGWVILHQSYGTPRAIYTLYRQLERHQIYPVLKVSRGKRIPSYQLLVPKKSEQEARLLLKKFKKRVHGHVK